MRDQFITWNPKRKSAKLLAACIGILNEYHEAGYAMTLRQLYYQLVSRNVIPNADTWYNRLKELVSNARRAGFIDWDDIVDNGRIPRAPSEWPTPQALLREAANQYRRQRWEGQTYYTEVWCEKDALSSILEPVCSRYHVTLLANRGYSSDTAMYDAARRFERMYDAGREIVVIYMGDHDPSGIDMTRDIEDRLELMGKGVPVTVRRLALNLDQVDWYNPPPNPTKFTDSRASEYIAQYGYESWELDALTPQVMDELVSRAIDELLDRDKYTEQVAQEEVDKESIRRVSRYLGLE